MISFESPHRVCFTSLKYCSNHLILSSWQIPQTAVVPPQVYRRLSGTSRFHSAVVSASTFPSKIPNNDQAPQSWRKGSESSSPSEWVNHSLRARRLSEYPNIFFRFFYRPWYKPEPTSAFDIFREKLLVKLGIYAEMPGPQYVGRDNDVHDLAHPFVPPLV